MANAAKQATHMSLHIDDPAGTGANELTGGNPAYARVAITSWADGSPGTCLATLAGPFNVPASTDVTWAGLWKDNTYLDKAPCEISTVGQEVVNILMVAFVVP
jgi:hypothetical protein